MRIALAANPGSGRDTDRDAVAARLRAAGAEVVEAEQPAERLAIAGGDGTVAVAAALAARRGLPLAVLPTGTANDFARALGLPLDLDAAARLAADPAARERAIDLAWLEHGGEDRVFLNAASAGLSPHATSRASALKRRLGPLAYAVGAAWAGLTAPPVACRVRADGEQVFAGRAWTASIAGTGAFGGGASVGCADPGDGRLDVVIAPAGSRLGLARLAWGMRTGRLDELSGVTHVRARRVEVETDEAATPFSVDGELVRAGAIACRVEPGAVRVLVP